MFVKKTVASIALIATLVPTAAQADNWIAPAIIGGIIGYSIGTPRTAYAYPQPIYQAPPQVIYMQPRQAYAYPPSVPVPFGMQCQLRSDYYNGQVYTYNQCY